MTLFEYIITNLVKADKNKIDVFNIYHDEANSFDKFICRIKTSNYFKENKEHSKILFNAFFSIMFRLIKEEMGDSFHKFFKNFNSKTNNTFYLNIHKLKKNASFDSIEIIDKAFLWEITDEGDDFWFDLALSMDKKFLNLIQDDVI